LEKFLKYFENKDFVRWVLRPDEQLEKYWNDYLEKNPQEREEVAWARYLVSQLQSKKEADAAENESVNLLSEIIQQIERREKKSNIRKIAFSLARYAAVGILFFFLGIAYYYFQKPDSFSDLAEQMYSVQDENNVQLILGDGKNVSIGQKESTVEYRADGKIVINSQDTLAAEPARQKQVLNQLVIPFGKNSSITLPDGTIAYLNAGSRLVYPNFFKGKNREVILIGEGFFDVAPNKKIPFVVQTNDLNVVALGTRFNLSAYPADNSVETVLVEGKVKIDMNGLQPFKNDYILKPNQLATYNRTSAETKIKNVDVINYVSWHEGYLNFESSDLSRIVKKLERYYNINIILDDPMLGIRSITGKLHLRDETEYVLEVLAKTASAEVKQLNETTYVLM
jgi:transmembrane sensor